MSPDQSPRGLIAGAMILLLGASIGGLLFIPIPTTNRDIIVALVSVGVVASVKDIVGFYFGSSRGSDAKDATIAALAQAPAAAPPVPQPSAPVAASPAP
jgi:hypothetical protein